MHRVGNTRDKYRKGIARLDGESHNAAEVFGAITVQKRRVPDLLEPQIGRCPVVLIVIIDDI